MSFFKQLRLLLRQKILLRRRQPTTLVLELFWPALVFMAVFVVRLQFPPINRQTCYYNSKALPSAGSVNFWQSLVCNIDNPCINSSTYREIPQYPNARIHSMVEQLSPLLTDKNVTSVIRDLPKGIRLIATIVETLSQTEVKSTLESGLPFKAILRESGEEKLREFLMKTIRNSKALDTIQILVNSKLNIVKLSLLSKKSSKPLREVICDPHLLADYVLIDNLIQLKQVSESLCLLEKSELLSLLQLIQDELDFVQVLHRLSNIMQFVGLNDFLVHIKNIAAMIDTIDRTNIFSSVTALMNTSWATDVPLIIKGFKSGEIEMKTLLKIASDIEPLFRQLDKYEDSNDQYMEQSELTRFYDSDDIELFDDYDLSIYKSNRIKDSNDFDLNMSESNSFIEIFDINKKPALVEETKIVPKLIANMDQFIDSIENFTQSNRWTSFMRVFQGIETIFEIMSQNQRLNINTLKPLKLETLLTNLPERVQSLTSALNHLFPGRWHLLPWANRSLHQTIDSILSHLLEAFKSSTNDGNIHYLPELVHLLLMSVEKGTLPRKCTEWTHALCDKQNFMTIFPVPITNIQKVQELSCKLFGQNNWRLNVTNSSDIDERELLWGETSAKILDIYVAAKKSLSDTTWSQIFNATHDAWHSQSIPDRIIFGSRIIQLFANCFVPEELIKSSFWKEIYKYKNVANEVINLIIDEINHSTETETLVIDQLSLGSPTLADLMNKLVALLPDLIKTIIYTITEDMPSLIEKIIFSQQNWFSKFPCNGVSLCDLLPTLESNRSAILEVEQLICQQKIANKEGGTGSILDELMANPRIAAIVMVLQSRSSEPHDVHMFLPQLDWIEAATSLALIKESIQKVLSIENGIKLFPEIEYFDERIRQTFRESRNSILNMPKQGVPRLFAYLSDIAMPLAIKFFTLNESFHRTCDQPLNYFEENKEERISKQWQCSIVGIKFAFWSINQLTKLFNKVLENYLRVKSFHPQNSYLSKCLLVDNNIPLLIENIPQTFEIMLNALLISNEVQLKNITSLHDLICSSNIVPEVFERNKSESYSQIKSVLCSLFDKNSINNCNSLFLLEEWAQSLNALNSTWFQSTPIQVNASFTQSLKYIHQFLSLFGQFRPNTINKISAKLMNRNNWWFETINKLNKFQNYKKKRFTYVMQTLASDLLDIMPKKHYYNNNNTRNTLIALTFGLSQLKSRLETGHYINSSLIDVQINSLLDWSENYLLVSAETLMQTIALDSNKFIKLFENKYSLESVWNTICKSPVGQYFIIDNNLSVLAQKGKESICRLNWTNIYDNWLHFGTQSLNHFSDNEIITLFLTKSGEILDTLLFGDYNKKTFLKIEEWKPIFDKINRLMSQTNQSTVWLSESIGKVIISLNSRSTASKIIKSINRLNCGLSAIKSGLTWESVPLIYKNKSDALSLYSTINSGFTLSSIAINTFLIQKKFQNFLDVLIKPKTGLNTFCSIQSDAQFQYIFAMPSSLDFIETLKQLQNLLCRTNTSLLLHMNPISNCFNSQTEELTLNIQNSINTLFGEISYAIESTKHVHESDLIPPILDKSRWIQFSKWWSDQVEPHPKSSFTLLAMRGFQLADSLSSNHVIWKAFYQTVFEISETFAYVLKAFQVKEKSDSIYDNLFTSTLANLMFPEVNDFISIRTYKQLRWIKTISNYFSFTPNSQEETCARIAASYSDRELSEMTVLLCRNHPSEWVYATNMANNFNDMRTKVNYLAKSISEFIENANTSELQHFIKGKQMETIESIAGTSVVFMLAASHTFKKMSFEEIMNTSWHTIPRILDSVDKYICTSSLEKGTFIIPNYNPKSPNLKTMICELPTWNFTEAYYWVSEHLDVKNMLNIIQTNGTLHQCVTPLKFISRWLQIGQLIVDQISSKNLRNEIKECYSVLKRESLWTHSLRYIKFVNGIISLVNKLSIENSWSFVRQIWKTMSYFILNQIPAYVPITDIIKKDVVLPKFLNSSQFLNNPLSKSKSALAISLLISSSLNINAIAWKNFSSVALQEMICGKSGVKSYDEPTKLPIIVSNIPLDSQQEKTLYEYLCNDDKRLESLINAFDTGKIDANLPELQKNELSKGEWLERVVTEVKNVTPQFSNIYDLGFKINNGKSGSIVSLIQLTRASTLNSVIKRLNDVIEKLRPKLGEGPIIEAFLQIMLGLESLRELSQKGLFEIKYQFRELIKNVEAVEVFMEYHLGVEQLAVQTILSSTIDLTEYVAKGEIDSNFLCNRTQLFEVLSVPKNEFGEEIAPLDVTSHAICTLSIAENYRFTNQILKQLAVRKIINNFVKLIADGVLTKAHLQNSDIRSALQGLKAAAKAMPYVKGFVSNFSSSLDLEEELDKIDLNGNGIELLGSPQASIILGKLMCGQSLPALSKEMQLMKVLVKKPKISEADAAALPSQFCQHGYRQIMQMQGGAVIWAFLKPILAGKVLYTPKNEVTDAIMSRMNSTFTFMSGFVDILHAWAQTISSLETFYRNPNANHRIKSVKHLIVQFLGKEVEGLFEDVDTFNLIERLAKAGGILGLVKLIGNIAQCVNVNRFIGLSNELELENVARKLTKSHEFIAGIVFMNLDNNGNNPTKLPQSIEYKIRIDIDFVPSTKALKSRIWEPGPRDNYLTDLGYFKGFVEIQEMVDRAITSMLINDTKLVIEPAVHLQQFPYLCYEIDKFGNYIRALSPLITTIAWIFLIAYLIREHVLERELHLEEVLRVMGLKPGVAWMTWFLMGLSVMAFGTLCGLLILKFGGLIPNSDPILLYLFFMSFCLSLLMYCYMMSSFFKTATIAALSGIVAYLASFLPFMVAITFENEMTYLQKVFTCFSMSTAFCYGMMYMSRFEVQGVGMQWTNLWHSPMQGDTMNVGTAIIMMLVDSIIYFFIAWYISHVNPPGNNASRHPWYFFLTLSYWRCNTRSNIQNTSARNGKNKKRAINDNNPGMELHGLYVIFNKSRKCKHVAVSNLNLSLKEGQITTMLGRNGAGKTTTINVLTGQLPPTAGSVYIYGHPVPEEFMQARKLLGYCPQYNTLFNEMTVREHLQFYSELKGLLDDEDIEDDINNMLHSTGLWHLQHHLVKHLSGGLQRRLCVALAFVGGSKLIILDEPTASVDPVARRSIWDLIVQQKQSRTVLLTTHHMDEAEILSDEVAVIHRGKLLCVGSPLLLKSKYGCGYQLTVSRQGSDDGDNDSGRSSNGPTDESIDVERLMAFTKCLIPNASLVEDYSGEVILALPQHGPYGTSHDYATFFRCLDANINALGFGSYGLTSTTLEEVFLTLCNLEESNLPMEAAKLAVARKLSHPLSTEECVNDIRMQLDPSIQTLDWTCPQLVDGIHLKFKQLGALLNKRFIHTLRDWKSLFCTLFLPCIFIAFAMGMTLIKPAFAPDPALPLMPLIYGQSTASFYSSPNCTENIKLISNELIEMPLITPNCLKPRDNWKTSKCPILKEMPSEISYLPKHLRTLDGEAWTTNAALCKCNECQIDMSAMAPLVPPPLETGHGFAYDLSNVEISDFLLRTYSEFMDRRWGGWSFHQINDSINNDNIIKIWFDNNGYHSLPSYLSAINNAIMKANLKIAGVENSSNYRITTYSHPLHIRSSQLGDQSTMQRAGDAGIALIILVGFIFIPTSFVFYIVRERTFEEKQLQRIFGVGTVLYWISSLLWDMMSLIIAIGFSAVIISCFQLPIYMAHLNLPAVLTLLFLFGWAMTTLVYLMEKLFSEASIAFMVIYCLALFIGINTMVMRLLIDVFKLIEVSPTFQSTFEKVAMIFPPYVLLSGLVDIHRNQLFADIFTLFDQNTYVNPFSLDMLAPYYIILALEGVVLFFANLIIEYFNFSSCKSKKIIRSNVNSEDSDVAEERRKVHLNDGSNDILRILGVTKSFQSMFGKRVAVDNVSFSIPKGECFGLLGVNGAGKTTLFRILTGQLKPTTGQAIINGKDIRKTLSTNYQSLGYCPQADALDFVLTPFEHLTIYAHLRGIPSQHIPTIVNESLAKFQLMPHSQMPVVALSRGNRRKLCLAIAMLGNPQLALLDEPTSGLDPQSRRYICQNIQNAIRDRRSILLTSHSMEECDILCSRLAIMVNGSFKCIGSPQYLKHKFGSGYLITLRLSESEGNCNDAISLMSQCFPSCILRAHHHTMLEFSLPSNDIPLSNIFENLQKAQENLNLQDFSVSQTTLDQVFVSFANQQVNDYQSTLSSKEKSVYTNPTFISSSEHLNSKIRKNNENVMRNRNRLREIEDNKRIKVATRKVNYWNMNENTTKF